MNIGWSILSFFLGLYLGHRLALGRDRRKEFNERAESLFLALQNETKGPGSRGPTSSDFAVFRRHLHWWQLKAFDRAVCAYQKARDESWEKDEFGGVYCRDAKPVISAVDRLLSFTDKR